MAKTTRTFAVVGIVAAVMAQASVAPAATVTVDANRAVLVDGEPFFPIMQWLQCKSRMSDQVQVGINTFVGNGCSGESSQEFLDEAAVHGAWGVVDPSDMSVASHAALLGWVFGDEPDLQSNQVEPAEILTEYNHIKSTDPDHITFLTLTGSFYSEFSPPDWMQGSRDRYHEYPNGSDFVGFDIYPVYGWCRPDWLYRAGAAQEELRNVFAPNKPTYQWIECSDESGQYCELCDRCSSPGPSCDRDNPCDGDGTYPDEVRNQVWQAIVHGATAIGYFTHAWECPGYTQYCVGSELSTELTRTNAQITTLTGPILGDAFAGSVTAQPTGGEQVDVSAKVHNGRTYVFAVNVDRAPATVTFAVSPMTAGAEIEVVDESRTITATGESFDDSFEPLEVHVYALEGGGGAPPDGGSGGTGGSGGGGAGSGGSGGSGGTGASGGAIGADGGLTALPADAEDDGGCGCRVGSRSDRTPSWWIPGAVVALLD